MTNEEILGVAEIVERATNRFNEQAARFRERSAAYDRLIAEMNADHERKMAEHRAAFGARTEADAKIIEGLRAAADEQVLSASKVAYVLRCAGETPVQAAQRVVKERDGLLTQVQDQRAEIERLRADIAEELNESPPAPPEASHDTPAGKEAAKVALLSGEIKVGDKVRAPFWKAGMMATVTEILPDGRLMLDVSS